MPSIKDLLRKQLIRMNIGVTENLRNDILLKKIMKKVLNANSNTIDIGAYKGEITELILKIAPNGQHFAFEPNPVFFEQLQKKFGNKVKVFPFALSDEEGESTFYVVGYDPALSGLSRRNFDARKVKAIKVQVKRLDAVIPKEVKIDFIKIDVEGAEGKVLKGGIGLITRHRPIIAFEFGKGGSEYFNTYPETLFNFFDSLQYDLWDYASFLKGKSPLTKETFRKVWEENQIYNFVAVPKEVFSK